MDARREIESSHDDDGRRNESEKRERKSVLLLCLINYRSIGVELGDLDDSFHGLQRRLAQDSSARRVWRPSFAGSISVSFICILLFIGILFSRRVQGLEADDAFEAVL